MTEMCREVRDAIALEGRAPESEDHQEHMSACTDCAQFLTSVLAVEDELGALSALDVSDETVEALLARSELSARSGRSRTLYWAMGLTAAAMMAFVAARVTLLGRSDLEPTGGAVAIELGPIGDGVGAGAQREGEELSENVRRELDALGYIAGGDGRTYGAAGDQALEQEMREAEVERDELQARAQKLNEPDYFETREDFDNVVENKNEALKNDGARSSVATASPDVEAVFEQPDGGVAGGVPGGMIGGTFGGLPDAPAPEPPPPASVEERVDKAQLEKEGFKSRVLGRDELTGADLQYSPEPQKLVHVDAVYPAGSKQKRATGIVVLRALIDAGGNVTRTIVVESVEGLDQAAVDAVMQWKYEKSDDEERTVTVRIAFETPAAPNDDDARLFLEERERIDGLRFRDKRGYWANTYLPGDPKARFLAMRLAKAGHPMTPHAIARPIAQPFDAPHRGALALTLHADHRGIAGPERVLVQVGIQATKSHGRRRPPMNVGVVLDATPSEHASARALVDALLASMALGDRFRLIVPGQGEVVSPESFRHGPLAVALTELGESSGDVEAAVRLAMERVHAGDDPTMPLGTSLVLVLTTRDLGRELDALGQLAHQSAVGGVPVSVVGISTDVQRDALERLALAGQGRRYFLERPADAADVVDRELAASSRAVARALRLRIKLAAGVKLIDVVGSHPLNERQAQRVREAEKSIDLRLSRNLGIEADRGEDEDGIQMVIPSFYAGDAHTILLDVVVTRPGAIAEVTARYKDLAELRNTVAKVSLALPRSTSLPGPLETNVVKNYLAFRLSEVLERAADELERGDRTGAIATLQAGRRLLTGMPFARDTEISRDVAMLQQYESALTSSTEPAFVAYLADSLRLASASKQRLPELT